MLQIYVFTGPDGWAWCEIWEHGRNHVVPTPFRLEAQAYSEIKRRNPDAIVDYGLIGEDLAACRAAAARVLVAS